MLDQMTIKYPMCYVDFDRDASDPNGMILNLMFCIDGILNLRRRLCMIVVHSGKKCLN